MTARSDAAGASRNRVRPGTIPRFLGGPAAGTLAASVLTVLLAGGPAGATPGLVVDPLSGPPGTTLKLVGGGFCPPPCSPVTISVGSLIVESGVPVDATGGFTTFVVVPDSTRPPTAPVTAAQTTAASTPVSSRQIFTVTVSRPAPVLYPRPAQVQAPTASPAPQPTDPTTSAPTTSAPPAGAPTTAMAPTVPAPSPTVSSPSTTSPHLALGPHSDGGRSLSWSVILATAVTLPLAAAVAVAVLWRRARSRRRPGPGQP